MFTNESDIIRSPDYPNAYGANVSCEYVISQPNGTYIKLTLLSIDIADYNGTWEWDADFDTVDGTTCGYDQLESGYDRLEIRDGMHAKAPLMERLCGNENDMSLPMTFFSTENEIIVRLVSIIAETGAGSLMTSKPDS